MLDPGAIAHNNSPADCDRSEPKKHNEHRSPFTVDRSDCRRSGWLKRHLPGRAGKPREFPQMKCCSRQAKSSRRRRTMMFVMCIGAVASSVSAATARREPFGALLDGTPVESVVLTGTNGVSARIRPHGRADSGRGRPGRERPADHHRPRDRPQFRARCRQDVRAASTAWATGSRSSRKSFPIRQISRRSDRHAWTPASRIITE
jgi:hypothetical protein